MNEAPLRLQVEQAKLACDRTLKESIRAKGRDSAEHARADAIHVESLGQLGDLYRELAKVTGEPFAVPLDIPCEPALDVSGAVLVQYEHGGFILFNPRVWQSGFAESACALVKFPHLFVTKMGMPNEEAFPAHPLYERGLEYFPVAEVLNSEWAREAEAQNQVRFPAAAAWHARHFVFRFKDASFECLAPAYDFELLPNGRTETLDQIASRLDA